MPQNTKPSTKVVQIRPVKKVTSPVFDSRTAHMLRQQDRDHLVHGFVPLQMQQKKGVPIFVKGQGIYCYVTLMAGNEGTDELRQQLVKHVRGEIGPIAAPDKIQFAPGLPKTRSGKIMRRILRKIAEDDFGSLGDTSTLADPAVVEDLIANRQNKATA